MDESNLPDNNLELSTVETVISETNETFATEESVLDFPTYEDQISYLRSCKDYKTYQWMVNLKAEDVEYIEFVNLSDVLTPYRRYDEGDIQEVIDLFQKNTCIKYLDSASWDGYYTQEFHVILKDGTAHSVCSVGNAITVIDGAAFESIFYWIGEQWPWTGNGSLPENWEESVANRNYQIVEDEVSFLGTWVHDTGRAALDRQYDTSTFMGSDSRNYPIGRGNVTLYAQDVSMDGLTLRADWTGSYGGRKVLVESDYWLEQWSEEEQTYIALEAERFPQRPEVELAAQESVWWYVNWKDVYKELSAGYYRIGLTMYESLNGVKQNETLSYAKFQIVG